MAVEVAGDEVSSMVRSKKKLTFLDLPVEAQKEIISHVCALSSLFPLDRSRAQPAIANSIIVLSIRSHLPRPRLQALPRARICPTV